MSVEELKAEGGGVAATDEDTARFGGLLIGLLRPGDTVMLFGELGAGKSALARAAIHAAHHALGLDAPETPSPTYTLVQTYEIGAVELWHADLYRLGDAEECLDLGLIEAFASAISFVEWPQRLGDYVPSRRLEIELSIVDPAAPGGGGRRLRWRAYGAGWDAVARGLSQFSYDGKSAAALE